MDGLKETIVNLMKEGSSQENINNLFNIMKGMIKPDILSSWIKKVPYTLPFTKDVVLAKFSLIIEKEIENLADIKPEFFKMPMIENLVRNKLDDIEVLFQRMLTIERSFDNNEYTEQIIIGIQNIMNKNIQN